MHSREGEVCPAKTEDTAEMRVLQKHVAKEILVPFAIAFTVITFLMVVGELLHELADRFLNRGLALSDMALLILYVLPSLIIYTLPIALLFATLIAFIQLSQDSEIIAMKAAGIPIRKVFAPAIIIGVAATILLFAFHAAISPWARRQLRVFIVDTVLEKPILALSEQRWTRETNNMRIFVGHIDDKRMVLKDINILVKDEDEPHRTIVAESGRIYIGRDRQQIFLDLDDGSIHEYDQSRPDRYSVTTFQRLTIPVNISTIDRYVRRHSSLDQVLDKEMSLGQIVRKARNQATRADERRDLLKRFGERTALAFMPLTFVLIGAPLGIIPHKARRFYGLAICAGMLLAYYTLLVVGETLAKKDFLNPLLAMWIPNLFLGMAGVAFMIRAGRH